MHMIENTMANIVKIKKSVTIKSGHTVTYRAAGADGGATLRKLKLDNFDAQKEALREFNTFRHKQILLYALMFDYEEVDLLIHEMTQNERMQVMEEILPSLGWITEFMNKRGFKRVFSEQQQREIIEKGKELFLTLKKSEQKLIIPNVDYNIDESLFSDADKKDMKKKWENMTKKA